MPKPTSVELLSVSENRVAAAAGVYVWGPLALAPVPKLQALFQKPLVLADDPEEPVVRVNTAAPSMVAVVVGGNEYPPKGNVRWTVLDDVAPPFCPWPY